MVKKKVRGRPKKPEPIKTIASIKGTDDFEEWVDKIVSATQLQTRTLAMKHGLAELAKKFGVSDPMPIR